MRRSNFIKFVKVFISNLKYICINNNDKILRLTYILARIAAIV